MSSHDSKQTRSDRRVLLLGAGLVTPPVIEYLLDRDVTLTVAGNNPERASELVGGRPGGRVVEWAIDDQAALDQLVGSTDLVISLLPATMHPRVAEVCLTHGRDLVTASYVSAEMSALDQRARAAGLMLLNELGVDPGIDHMSAMRVIHDVQRRGGRINSFRSYCGGLPAPDANDNPWGYKFSWNPLGVLRATTSSAVYLDRGEVRQVPSQRLFVETHPLTIGEMSFEAYANRDSLDYIPRYGLEGIETMYRGTLRWPGWAATMRALRALGLLEAKPASGSSWPAILASAAGLQAGSSLAPQLAAHLRALRDDRQAPLLTVTEAEEVLERFEWLGLLDEGNTLEGETTTAALAALMAQRMLYRPAERDMLVMQHRFEAHFDGSAGPRQERLKSTMIVHGDPRGFSAMARTVGLPVAIAARMVIDRAYHKPGVQIPLDPALYQPILDELAAAGITLAEETEERS